MAAGFRLMLQPGEREEGGGGGGEGERGRETAGRGGERGRGGGGNPLPAGALGALLARYSANSGHRLKGGSWGPLLSALSPGYACSPPFGRPPGSIPGTTQEGLWHPSRITQEGL